MNPLKRAADLVPLSKDHHFALLLCWKIRTGFDREIDPERIKKYCDWFYINHLMPHFEIEEKYLFPILGNEHELVKHAIADHRRLHILFHVRSNLNSTLTFIEKELEAHIRFEERELFAEIQQAATPEELKIISEKHSAAPHAEEESSWADHFWL